MTQRQPYINLIKKNTGVVFNLFNLGFIQASNAAIQLLLFPIIIHIIGFQSFGYIALANAYASLMGILVNYGTNLSGIKDIALAKHKPYQLSSVFFSTIYTRCLLCLISFLPPLFLWVLGEPFFIYLLFATPIILAEAVNPLFFFNGIENLSLYNYTNLLARISSTLLIVFLIQPNTPPEWINFFLGISNLIFFLALTRVAISKYRLMRIPFSILNVTQLLKNNFFLVFNNMAAHLQQSFIIFLLPLAFSPMVLSAYSLCDKIIWSFRMLLIAISSAIYPKAAVSYERDNQNWLHHKQNLNYILAAGFILIGMVLYFANTFIIRIFTGDDNELASQYLRMVCIVPFLAAMNSLNVIELLIGNRYKTLFYATTSILTGTILIGLSFLLTNNSNWLGVYPVIIEILSLSSTIYFMRKK